MNTAVINTARRQGELFPEIALPEAPMEKRRSTLPAGVHSGESAQRRTENMLKKAELPWQDINRLTSKGVSIIISFAETHPGFHLVDFTRNKGKKSSKQLPLESISNIAPYVEWKGEFSLINETTLVFSPNPEFTGPVTVRCHLCNDDGISIADTITIEVQDFTSDTPELIDRNVMPVLDNEAGTSLDGEIIIPPVAYDLPEEPIVEEITVQGAGRFFKITRLEPLHGIPQSEYQLHPDKASEIITYDISEDDEDDILGVNTLDDGSYITISTQKGLLTGSFQKIGEVNADGSPSDTTNLRIDHAVIATASFRYIRPKENGFQGNDLLKIVLHDASGKIIKEEHLHIIL